MELASLRFLNCPIGVLGQEPNHAIPRPSFVISRQFTLQNNQLHQGIRHFHARNQPLDRYGLIAYRLINNLFGFFPLPLVVA
jgi:hypothetical protein